MENNSVKYKGYLIENSLYAPNNHYWFYASEKRIVCSPQSVVETKLLVDGWEYPKEFNNKLEDIINGEQDE